MQNVINPQPGLQFAHWWMKHRAAIMRAAVAVFLWAVVLSTLLISLRTLDLSEDIERRWSSGALTPLQAAREMRVRAAAEAFTTDYLSFSNDRAEYASRMKRYGEFKAPAGEQKVTYAGVEQMNYVNDHWRLAMNVHLTRYITVNEKDLHVPEGQAIRRFNDNGCPMAVYPTEMRERYEVSVCDDDGMQIIGTPVLIDGNALSGQTIDKLVDDDEYPADFAVFIKQVIPMYYKGEDLANFSDASGSIGSASGYSVENVRITRFEEHDNQARSAVSADLVDRGTSFNQLLIVEAIRTDNCWLLTRIGGL